MSRRMPGVASQQSVVPKEYCYRCILNNNIEPSKIGVIVIGLDDLSYDMDKLVELLENNSSIKVKFQDYESALFVDKVLKRPISNKSFLIDDAERKDRSYIDLTKLTNINLIVPLNYLMWGIKFNESIDTYCFLCNNPQANYLKPMSLNGNKKLSYDDYIKILKKIEELSKIVSKGDEDKVALISDYLQSRTQFIEGYESVSSRGTFITPDFPKDGDYSKKSGLVETVMNNYSGVCMGIANVSTLLLNNPQMDVKVESVYGESHVWNKVLIDGKYYYFDNTWAITRNDDMSEEGLMALSFSKKYLLFGKDSAKSMGHHNPESVFIYDGILSEEDKGPIDYQQQFTYHKKPIYKSMRK